MSKSKKDWFSAPMIMAYVAILSVLGTSVENMRNRLKERKEDKADKIVTNTIHETIVDAILERMDAIEEQNDLYLEAILTTMPSYKRRQVERFIEEESIGIGEEEASEEIKDVYDPIPEAAAAIKVTAKATAPTAPKLVKLKSPETLFGQVQQQAKQKNLNNDKIKEMIQDILDSKKVKKTKK